jgi:hypothetical protein
MIYVMFLGLCAVVTGVALTSVLLAFTGFVAIFLAALAL